MGPQQLLSYSAAAAPVEGLKASKSTASTFWSAKTWSPGALDWSMGAIASKGDRHVMEIPPGKMDPSDGLQQKHQKPRNSSF